MVLMPMSPPAVTACDHGIPISQHTGAMIQPSARCSVTGAPRKSGNNPRHGIGEINQRHKHDQHWQFAPTWVLGIEGDFDWADLRKSGTVAPLFSSGDGDVLPKSSFTASEDIRYLASIRGRIGYVWNNDWLA